ncbi:hypothetical protein [Wenzhou sobemo-like virus 1]|uniref:hypothetical protein n=1 Tax=Wenzhou sobemo-like virus 1 TaxID=1923657 RepID=UPI00090BF014|nr:hypothetical protein [Wenzhou sobemo-like virus 1]APG75960.1 hypothetical protein [Wenzhou sobemo-like virus 1]
MESRARVVEYITYATGGSFVVTAARVSAALSFAYLAHRSVVFRSGTLRFVASEEGFVQALEPFEAVRLTFRQACFLLAGVAVVLTHPFFWVAWSSFVAFVPAYTFVPALVVVLFKLCSFLLVTFRLTLSRFFASLAETLGSIGMVAVVTEYSTSTLPSFDTVQLPLVHEGAVPGSSLALRDATMSRSIGLLYYGERWVGMCGRVGNRVVTAAHLFHVDGELVSELTVVPAHSKPGDPKRSAVLRLSDAKVLCSKPINSADEHKLCDVLVWRVADSWPVLKRVLSAPAVGRGNVYTFRVDDALSPTGGLCMHSGPVRAIRSGVLAYHSDTHHGSSGSLVFQYRGSSVRAVAVHIGQYNTLNFGYSLAAFTLNLENSNVDEPLAADPEPQYYSEVPVSAVDGFRSAVPRVRLRQVKTLEQLYQDLYGDQDVSWADGSGFTFESTPPRSPVNRRCEAYKAYLATFDVVEEPSESCGVGLFELVRSGTMALPFSGRSRAIPADVPVCDRLNNICPYAGVYQYPPKDAGSQFASLLKHSSLAKGGSVDADLLKKAIERVSEELAVEFSEYPLVSRCASGEGHGFTDPADARAFLLSLDLKLDSTPGVLFHKRGHLTKGDVVQEMPIELLDVVASRLYRLANGYVDLDPIKVFIKEEPHKISKIRDERYRIISSISLVDDVCERLIVGPMNAAIKAQHRVLPVRVGMGNTEQDVSPFFSYLGKDGSANTIVTSDISAHDWSLQEVWFRALSEVRARIFGQSIAGDGVVCTSHATLYHRLNMAIISSPFVLSDGAVYTQRVPGIQRSGRFDTSVGNSIIRTLAQYVARPDTIRSVSMGDDNVSSYHGEINKAKLIRSFAKIGFSMKNVEVVDASKSVVEVEFCSHRYSRVSSGSVTLYAIKPANPSKAMAKFAFTARGRQIPDNVRIEMARSVCNFLQSPGNLPALVDYAFTGRNDLPESDCDDADIPGLKYPGLTLHSASGGAKRMAKKKKNPVAVAKQVVRPAKPQQQPPKRKAPTISLVREPSSFGFQMGRSSYSMRTVSPNHVRVTGHEILGVVSSFTGAAGEIAYVFDANPACWTTSRLSLVARAWEKYRYNTARLHFVPAVGTNSAGSIVCAVETDADEKIPGGDVNAITRAMNGSFSVLTPVWQYACSEYKRDPDDKTWYVATAYGSGSRAESTQFISYGVTDTSLTGAFGRVVIDYDIEFLYPELEFVDGGSQYTRSVLSFNSAAINTPVLASMTVPNAQIIEIRNLGTTILQSTYQRINDYFDFAPGSVAYLALQGAYWVLCRTLDAAKSGNGLTWTSAVASTIPISVGYRVIKGVYDGA